MIARPLEIETRPLRNAGPSIPRVALGCGNFGGIGSSLAWVGHGQNEDEALALMDAAWELGLTHFDTADAYGAGSSELAIGRWIASRGIRPTLTTKTFNQMAEGADSGLGADRIARQFQTSLERLGVDHVELYLAHDYDPDTPLTRRSARSRSSRTRARSPPTGSATSMPSSSSARARPATRSRCRTGTRCSSAPTRPR